VVGAKSKEKKGSEDLGRAGENGELFLTRGKREPLNQGEDSGERTLTKGGEGKRQTFSLLRRSNGERS